MTFYLMVTVIFAQSFTICEIFAQIIIQFKKFYLKNEGQDQEEEKLGLAPNVRFIISDFIPNFNYLGTYLYARDSTNTATDMGDDYIQNLQCR